jgi:energy-coupling factor transporter transmembrane protein EcfT
MIVPFGKLEMVNCIDIGIDAFYIYDKKGFPLRHSFLTLCLLGIYFIYFKNRYYIIIGFILTYFWLIYKIDYIELISSLPVLISVLIYVLISFYTSFKIITNSKVSKG